MDFFVHEHLLSRCSFVHDVDFCDNTDGSVSSFVPLSGELEAVRNGEILVGWNHT